MSGLDNTIFKKGDYVKLIREDIENGRNYSGEAGLKIGDILKIKIIEFSESSNILFIIPTTKSTGFNASCFELVDRPIKQYGIVKFFNNLKKEK